MEIKYTSKKNAPTKYSKQRVHNEYGIRYFLKSRGILERKDQNELLAEFLGDNEFVDPKRGNIEAARYSFIQNRFGKFHIWVNKRMRGKAKEEQP